MSEKDTKKTLSETSATEKNSEKKSVNTRKFTLDEFKLNSISSSETVLKENVASAELNAEDVFSPKKNLPQQPLGAAALNSETDDLTKIENQIFRELAEPKLSELAKENRARLQMQSPTRLNFYWSVKDNPFQTLHRVFGKNAQNYTLVVKLRNQTTDGEEVVPVEPEGSWWFDVNADSSYQAEIGFYAPNHPFVRLMFSNTVETPRKNPSPHQASAAGWTVSADSFAQVLDASGFTQDAFEVALAGDDFEAAELSTQAAFAHFFGETENDFTRNNSSEMRFALLALASGYALENLRGQISSNLFAKLQKNSENLSAEKAFAALQENFDVFAIETEEKEFLSPTVFGASLINFPRVSKRTFIPKFSPVSSFNSNG